MARLGRFSEEEKAAMKRWSETCRMAQQAPAMEALPEDSET
jgi:hypothetical protein